MRKRNRMGSLVCLLLMASFLLAALHVEAKELQFAVLLPSLDIPHFIAQKYGYEDEARKLGVKLRIYDAGGYINLNRQIQQIEDATVAKMDAIILVSINPTGTIAAVEDAVRAGIPVINVNVMCDSPKIIARVRSDDREIGRLGAEYFIKKLQGKGNMIVISGAPGSSVALMRVDAFKDAIKNYPGMKILSEQWVQPTRAEGMRVTEDMLQSYGNSIHGIFCTGEPYLMGAGLTLEAAKKRNITVIGVDFNPDVDRAIREGKIAGTITQQTIMMGRMGVRLAKDVVEGKKVPPVTYTPVFLITAENLDSIDRSGFIIPTK